MSKDSISVGQTYTDSLGEFSLNQEKGSYTLKVLWFNSPPVSRDIELNQNLDLGELTVNESTNLDEIAIIVKKKVLERKTDRIVFNVSQSIYSSGSSALELLAITPLVSVDGQGNVSIVGKNKVGILVDDAILYLTGTELNAYLKMIRTENIERIELITSPTSKYDAQGNSGLINIVLKKNAEKGFSGNITSSLQQATYPSFSNGLTLNYQGKKIGSSFSIRQYYTSIKAQERYAIMAQQSLWSDDRRRDYYKGIGVDFSLRYALSTSTKIGVIYNYGKAINTKDVFNHSVFYEGIVPLKDLTTLAHHRNTNPTHTLNLYSQSKLSDRDDLVDFGFNYFESNSKSTINLTTGDSYKSLNNDIIKTNSDIDYQILSATADFVLNTNWSLCSFGVKYAVMRNNSTVGYFNLTDQGYLIDSSKSAVFSYDENIYAAYLDFTKTFIKSWELKLGLRYEYTINQGVSRSADKTNKSNYYNFFPSIYLKYNASESDVLYMSYAKRINRPSFREVDPFRWYSTPTSYSTGNPLLLPSYNNNFELGYLMHDFLSFDLYYQQVVNEFGQISNFENSVEVSTYFNYYNQESIGFNAMYTKSWVYFLEHNVSFNLAYVRANSKMNTIIGEKGIASSYYLNNTIILKPEQRFLFVNYWHRLPSKKGNSSLRNMASFDIGMKFLFFEKKLALNIAVNDLFQQLRAKGEKKFSANQQQFDNYYDSRNITFSATYTFGKSKNSLKDKTIDFEETSRAS
ncbi:MULTISPECIES: TonB-dependent receptor domain-containing protein [unclassified Myroides]|uniref:TonB-dependent receptor domain-containing protein n=1 Tax=unclassified Myroides TaxID=2642485 RepID=UPI003D2F74FC